MSDLGSPKFTQPLDDYISAKQNSPGTLVPSATKVMAVTDSVSPAEQPKCDAKSPISAVINPIMMMEQRKVSQPPK